MSSCVTHSNSKSIRYRVHLQRPRPQRQPARLILSIWSTSNFSRRNSNWSNKFIGISTFTGWYTVEGKDWNNALITSFYNQLLSFNESPLVLRLDPVGVSNELPLHVYETIVDLGTKLDFIEIPYTLVTEEAERIGIDHVARYSVTDGTSDTSIVSDQIAIQYNAIRLLYQRMLLLLEYVRAVKQGQLERNEDLLREIGSLCQRLPIINTDDNNNQMFRGDFDIQQSDVALLALLACCTQEISTLNDYMSKCIACFPFDLRASSKRDVGPRDNALWLKCLTFAMTFVSHSEGEFSARDNFISLHQPVDSIRWGLSGGFEW